MGVVVGRKALALEKRLNCLSISLGTPLQLKTMAARMPMGVVGVYNVRRLSGEVRGSNAFEL